MEDAAAFGAAVVGAAAGATVGAVGATVAAIAAVGAGVWAGAWAGDPSEFGAGNGRDGGLAAAGPEVCNAVRAPPAVMDGSLVAQCVVSTLPWRCSRLLPSLRFMFNCLGGVRAWPYWCANIMLGGLTDKPSKKILATGCSFWGFLNFSKGWLILGVGG